MQWLNNAFRSSGSAATRGRSASAQKKFALLPEQSEEQLANAELHSKLDVALNILQQDVGYMLLADARPSAGGGANLAAKKPATRIIQIGRAPKDKKEQEKKEEIVVDTSEERCVISAETAKCAHYKEDVRLVSRFAAILGEPGPDVFSKVAHDTLYRKVLQGVRLMHLCEYKYSDVVLVLAHASVYFKTTWEVIGSQMSEYEAAHVCVLLIYLSHAFLLDETCPLKHWQKHIFKKYCSLKVLDSALFRLFKMREFCLRLTKDEERAALQGLSGICYDPALAVDPAG